MLQPNKVKQALKRGEPVVGTMISEVNSTGFVWTLANIGYDFVFIDMEHGAFVLFNPAEKVDLVHVAFRVDPARFEGVVGRLRRRGIPFGNEPEDPRNGRTDDPLGGAGRVYFVDENGHLFEVTV